VEENIELATAGCCNLARHIENSRMFGVPVVVAVNQFSTDTEAELDAVKQAAIDAGASLSIALTRILSLPLSPLCSNGAYCDALLMQQTNT
jgi:formyltetrahydrofolate synthetase